MTSDRELIDRAVAGSRSAYGSLIERHQRSWFRQANALVHDPDLAEEIAQEVLVDAYGRLSDLRKPRRLVSWIATSIRNRCLDHLRSPRARHVALEDDSLSTGSEDLVRDLHRSEVQRDLGDALRRLPAEQREAFVLKHVEELSYQEMADRTGIGVSALKMRVKRAREALADALDHHRAA